MSTCLVLRIDDFTVYKVSTKSREAPRPLVSAEKTTLPGDAGLLHAELTHFYYPGDVDFPVPSPKLFVQLSPVRVSVDVASCVWLGAFLPHVARAASAAASRVARDDPGYCDELQICTARATLTNVRESPRSNTAGTRADLASILSALRRTAPPRGQFPCSADDMDPINEQFVLHADNLDDIDRGTSVSAELLWRENRSIWCARVEPLWAELCGARATYYKPAPLLDATPLTAWLCFNDDFSRIWAVARTSGLAGLQLNHYQMLFLMRQLERISEMTAWLTHDAARQPDANAGSIVVGVVVPAVELTLVLPSNCPGFSSMRRGLTSLVTSIDSAWTRDDARSDAASTASSDSERYVVVGLACESPLDADQAFSAWTRDDARSDAASTASSDSERYVVVGLACESPLDADQAFR
ncbi:hypothetical protein MSG28_009126 [Choristoneura fumiferana]|uniref:Uncharacterized protein n=1 Tax=Choristoneura fumiferana TaxID=7141 RepID=A0ACC0KWF3_CHOFU|nr:hypothetical protein MSG28_009126 [Choristoneura fumiferana]